MVYLGLSERATAAKALERMEATKMQGLDSLRFNEWTKDLRGLEFTQIVTVPYEASNVNVVMEDMEPEDRVWVRCASREVLAQAQLEKCCKRRRGRTGGSPDLVSYHSRHHERESEARHLGEGLEKFVTANDWQQEPLSSHI